MTKTDEEKKKREAKKKQRMVKVMNGTNYSNRLIRNFNNLKKKEGKAEIKDLRSTNNIKNNILRSTSDLSKTKLTSPTKNTRWNQDKGLKFVPFLQERDGMGKLIYQEREDIRKVKIIRLNTKANHHEKDFSNSIDLKKSLTHIVYDGVIEKKNEKERVLNVNVNAITTKSFFYDKENTIQDPINYSKFEIKKKFEPVYRNTAYEKENSSMPKTSSSFRPAITPNEMRREKSNTPCLGSYDYTSDMIFKKISRDFIFPNEHEDYSKVKNKTETMMNLSDIYQKLENHRKLVEDFGKQIGRSQSLLKWAPAIHETEKLKVKRKEQEFKEIECKDLERDYHFNRYIQKKYFINNFVPPFTQDIKKSIPLGRDDFKEKTIKLIQKYDFKSSLPEFKRILKVHL